MRSAESPPAHPIGTPQGLSPNTGPLASAAWLVARNLTSPEPRWYAHVLLDADPQATFEVDETVGTRFQLEIYAEEWGFVFSHQQRVSWIRVTDIAFVHGRDDHQLLADAPPLREIGAYLRALERRYAIAFPRHALHVRTSLPGSEHVIRAWAREL